MEKCKSYAECKSFKYIYDQFTGLPIDKYVVFEGICMGTREMDSCNCNGEKLNKNCIYYKDAKIPNELEIYKAFIKEHNLEWALLEFEKRYNNEE